MQSTFLVGNLIFLISIVSNLLMGFFIFLKGKSEKINSYFFKSILFAVIWLISLFLFYIVESPFLVLLLGRINYAAVLPMFYYLLEFSMIFPKEINFFKKEIKILLKAWIFLFTLITAFSSFVIKEEIITGLRQRNTFYGPLFPLYVFHYIIFSIFILGIFFYKLKRLKEEIDKIQIKYILVGLTISLTFGFITNIVLYSLGIYEAANYGPIATIIFFSFVSLAILKHYLFNIKVISVEFFTVFLLFTIFISIFIAQTTIQKILNIALLISASFFGFYLIKSVIQEIKSKEETQRLAKKLQKAYEELKVLDDAKSQFISMASHQLRTPLSAIKGYISMIIEGSYGNVPEKVKEKLKNVYQSNERLIRIVNDLLDISKIELGKMELEKEPIQIEEMVQSCYDELKIEAEKKKLKFILEKPETPLPKIEIDSLKIRQVIINLIDNAIKYTQEGEIKIKIERVNSYIRISVKDTGEGLDEKEKKEIFEEFTRGSAGINYFIEGAGLGLYVAKKFLELHNGRIWVESEGKGKGSTFYIDLPIGN